AGAHLRADLRPRVGIRLRALGQRAARIHRVPPPQARGRRRQASDSNRPRRGVRAAGAVAGGRFMSLRRRIAAAAALAVAAVAIAVAVTGYLTTRSHLIGEVQSELRARAQQFLGPHRGGDGPGPPAEGPGFRVPGAPPLGGAAGYFQVVQPDGTVAFGGQLPVSRRVLDVARNGAGSFFSDARVNRTHVEIYTVWDADDHHVVQVALPLTDDDAVLGGLLLPYGLLTAGGVLLALLLGLAISRSALRPIDRFVRQTEQV